MASKTSTNARCHVVVRHEENGKTKPISAPFQSHAAAQEYKLLCEKMKGWKCSIIQK